MRENILILICAVIIVVVGVGGFSAYHLNQVDNDNNDGVGLIDHFFQQLHIVNNDNNDVVDNTPQNNNVNQINNTSQNNNEAMANNTQTVQMNGTMDIKSVTITTGSSLSSKSHADVYVGEDHAGEAVTISTLYSRDGNNLNEGKDVDKTVDSDGYIHVNAAVASKYYPDTCVVTVKSSTGTDTVTCYLNIESGSQTCTFE